MKVPELLCPAGDENALHAAVDCGADAVYLGYKAFGARASAVNFDDEGLERAVRYAHLYHARIHVTVNTLVKPKETAGVFEALKVISACGADAVIVQDPGVAAMVREYFPQLHLHASTQMAICNAAGAEAVRNLGYDRVVLARECGLEEIRAVAATGIETEVFAHGALCTAVSGRCLMSSMSGGRSGNRGRCAQPCRQCFSMNGQSEPLLSMRDLCLIDDLPALCEAGATSLKIEGRLKSAEYVAVVTSVYRKVLDEIARGEHFSHPELKEELLQIFNRGGFTRGHAMGAEDADLISGSRVSHEGVFLGTIVSAKRDLAQLSLQKDLHDGDSLQLRGSSDEEMRYSGHDVPSGQMAVLHLRPGLFTKAGTRVFRLTDARQLENAREHRPARIPITMEAAFKPGEPALLTVSDGDTTVEVRGDIPQPAQKRSATAEEVCRQLEKLGESPYCLRDGSSLIEHVSVAEGLFLPVSTLNAMRRDALNQLTEERIRRFACPSRQELKPLVPCTEKKAALGRETLAVLFSNPSLATEFRKLGANLLIWAPWDFSEAALEEGLSLLPDRCWLQIPPQLTQKQLNSLVAFVNRHSEKLGGIMAESIGQLGLRWSVPVLAGEGVPLTNPQGIHLIAPSGISGFVLWPEWNGAEQKELLPLELPALLKVYGREQLMLLNHCPERVRRGLTANHAQCAICKKDGIVCGTESAALTDRKGYSFPLSRIRLDTGCEIRVLGALPTDLRNYRKEWQFLGCGMLLHFTVEAPDEQLSLVDTFSRLMAGEEVPPNPAPVTSGHWVHSVE